MINELDIVLNIYTDIIINIEHINKTKERIQKIKNNIYSLDNNYFETYCNDDLLNQYLNMFEEKDSYNELINNLETLKKYIENKIKNRCVHEWVDDLIDIDPDRSQRICYCVKCELTKK